MNKEILEGLINEQQVLVSVMKDLLEQGYIKDKKEKEYVLMINEYEDILTEMEKQYKEM